MSGQLFSTVEAYQLGLVGAIELRLGVADIYALQNPLANSKDMHMTIFPWLDVCFVLTGLKPFRKRVDRLSTLLGKSVVLRLCKQWLNLSSK